MTVSSVFRHFEDFLTKKRCLQQFIYNLEYHHDCNISIYEFITKVKESVSTPNYGNLISMAFDWTTTIEGNDYWFNIACWWSTYYYENADRILEGTSPQPAKGGCKSIW